MRGYVKRCVPVMLILLIVTSVNVMANEIIEVEADTGHERLWQYYKKRFVTSSGRVIDFGQDGISHSEGQGYTMLLATRFNDEALFERVWDWTKNHLMARKSDSLFAWSWGRRVTGEESVIDYNNAADGDIAIAWALLRAGKIWHRPEYVDTAVNIIRSIRKHIVLEQRKYVFLLPGYYGFASESGITINPSYFIFSAFREFASYRDALLWNRIYRDSLEIVKKASDNRQGLPQDWLLFDGSGFRTPENRDSVFGYEAIRVILYLSWENRLSSIPGVDGFLDYLEKKGKVPATLNPAADELTDLDSHEASAGMTAVWARAAAERGRPGLARRLWKMAREKIGHEKKDYYSHVLYLFAVMGMV